MKHNDWTDRLHDRLSDYKAVPPVGLWDKIETAVDGRRKRARTVRMRVICLTGTPYRSLTAGTLSPV